MKYEFVLVERIGRVGVVTLNRPDQLNTLHPQQWIEMHGAVAELDNDPEVGAIVMTATGRAFCAGADFKAWQDKVKRGDTSPTVDPIDASWSEVWRRSKPSVVAFNGFAIGAGLTIALGADYRIAADTATLSMRFAALGIIPEIQSTLLLPQICGLSNALDIMISGEMLDAAHSLRIGLVNEVVPLEDLRERAIAKAAQYAQNHPDTTKVIKQLVYQNFLDPDFKGVGDRENEANDASKLRPPHAEAVRAFAEKRKPDYYAAMKSA